MKNTPKFRAIIYLLCPLIWFCGENNREFEISKYPTKDIPITIYTAGDTTLASTIITLEEIITKGPKKMNEEYKGKVVTVTGLKFKGAATWPKKKMRNPCLPTFGFWKDSRN